MSQQAKDIMLQQANCEKAAELEKKIAMGDYTPETQDTLDSLKNQITDYNRTCAKKNSNAPVPDEATQYMSNGGRRGKKSRRNSKKRKTLRKKSTRRKTRRYKYYFF